MSKMGALPGSYVLVTPVKNEAQMLPGLFESLLGQSKRPVLWLIADDGSSDDGYEHAKKFAASNPWVVAVTRNEVPNPPWVKYGSAVAFGCGKALETAEGRKIDHGFVGRSSTRTRLLGRITSRSSWRRSGRTIRSR